VVEKHSIKASDYIASMALTGDGKTVITGSRDGTISSWDAATGKEKGKMGPADKSSGSIRGMAISSDGSSLVTVDQGNSMRLWELPSAKLVKTFDGQFSAGSRGVSLSADGKTVAARTKDNKQLLLLDTSTGSIKRSFPLKEPDSIPVGDVKLSSDGAYLAFAPDEKKLKIWETSSGNELAVIDCSSGGITTTLAFSHDNKQLAYYVDKGPSGKRALTVWDIPSKKPVAMIEPGDSNLEAVSFTSDDKTLSCRSPNKIWSWDIPSGNQRFALKYPLELYNGFLFASNGKTVFGGDNHGQLYIWEIVGGPGS
jgi:WD40 repeat protein